MMNSMLLSKKKSPLVILALISAIITGAMFYVEEGRHDFNFLITGEIFNFLIFYFLISLIPGGIYLLAKQTKYAGQSMYIALAGYIPALFLLLKMN